MANEMQKYQPSVNLVTQRVLAGLDELADEEAVDASLERAYVLMKFADRIKENIYEHAEQRQASVMSRRAGEFQEATKAVEQAGKVADVDAYDNALEQAIKTGILAKESAAKMHHIKNRGVEAYDSRKELVDYVRSIEASISTPLLPPKTGE
ncbi:Uncharacterised protein [uncultured archaeon]|nr:Uncharacterised protein [uncultured archaeon]